MPPRRSFRARALGSVLQGPLPQKLLRYVAGSVVATGCSEVVFLLGYGVMHAQPAVASGLGWVAGALPNYWLNRSWTWQRRGRPSLRREVLPYAAIVLGTVAVAAVATTTVDAALQGHALSTVARVGLVGGTFLGVYGAVFVIRFLLFDQLFRRAPVDPAPRPMALSAKEQS